MANRYQFGPFTGRSRVRFMLVLACVMSTIAAFVPRANGPEVVTLPTSVPMVGLRMMVLLALFSRMARE